MLTPAWVRKPLFLRIIATVMGGYFALSPACRSQQVLARANARRATGSEHGVNHVRLWAEKNCARCCFISMMNGLSPSYVAAPAN